MIRFLCLSILLLLRLNVSDVSAQVVINEYSCANRGGLIDSYNEREDWIELHNTSAAPFDISSYFLSDNENNLTKFQIPPATIIPANGYQIFLCSARNLNAGGFIHTNFKLTQTNPEKVIFTNPGGVVVDSLSITKTQLDQSIGRFPNGTGPFRIFPTPTPDQENGGANFGSFTATPSFTLNAGIYPGAINVGITTTEPGNTIRYTLNGGEPNATSPLYNGPIAVNANTVIRARSFSNDPDKFPGFIESNSYFININHTVPIVSLISDQYPTFFASFNLRIPGVIEYFSPDGTQRFEAVGESDRHGNDSWAYAQKGIDFVVRDQLGYDDQINYKIFPTKPRDKFQRIMFKAGASDNYPFSPGPGGSCHLRDAFIQSLGAKANMEMDYRTNDHVVVYINAQYWGLYEVREKVNDPDFTEYYYNQELEDLNFLSYWGGLQVRYGSPDDWNNLYNFIMNNDMSDPALYAQVDNRLNFLSVIDHMILNTWAVNSDWINWNTMWWQGTNNPNVKWKYVMWDMDNILNLGQNYTGWPTTTFNADPCALENIFEDAGPSMGHMDIFSKLMDNQDFKDLFVNRYAELINTYLSCDVALAHLDSIVNHILPEMPGQIARWGGSMNEWQNNLDNLRVQINGRCSVIDEGIVDCYDVNGPYRLAFNVEPANTGTIKFNQLLLPEYPWAGEFFGNVNGTLLATPIPGWEFDYWEKINHVFGTDSLLASLTFPILTTDSIVAHFKQIQTYDITFLVEPAGSGNISINGIAPGFYPFTQTYNEFAPINLSATPNPNFLFRYYTTQAHTLNPDLETPNVATIAEFNDTIIAHFEPIYIPKLWLNVKPEAAGNILLNDDEFILDYPAEREFLPNTSINAEAIPDDELFEFSHWTLAVQPLLADSAEAINGLLFIDDDTLIAHFKEKELIPQVVYVPSSFTPNGDGLNDEFFVFHSETVINGDYLIFNRWGEEIFKSNKLENSWDGRLHGNPMPEGVYMLVVNYYLKENYKETIQSAITLTR
jgi:gliding motility-associated-like protein